MSEQVRHQLTLRKNIVVQFGSETGTVDAIKQSIILKTKQQITMQFPCLHDNIIDETNIYSISHWKSK